MTTQRGGDAEVGSPQVPAEDEWFTRTAEQAAAVGEQQPPVPRAGDPDPGGWGGSVGPAGPAGSAGSADGVGAGAPAAGGGSDGGSDGGPDGGPDGAPVEGGRHQWSETALPAEKRDDGFDPSDTGTWRVTEVVPGGESGRRTTTILQYLLGLLAVDHVRKVTRWWFVLPVAGLLLLIFLPPWVGIAVVVLGVLVLAARIWLVRALGQVSLARRYRPVEEDLRSAVEAGKANLRSELTRVGLPSGTWALPLWVLRQARGNDRSAARSRLREVEIHRILPTAQLERALRVLDQAAPGR